MISVEKEPKTYNQVSGKIALGLKKLQFLQYPSMCIEATESKH